MISQYQTHKIIASILSYQSDSLVLKSMLSEPAIDWESIVKIGSSHLILPAIYLRLKQKFLLDVLPTDLKDYLEEITSINRNRNKSLLQDAKEISTLFKTQEINHVFVKGIALIAGDYFEDISERMIADIDILVDEKDIDRAFQLLLNNHFKAAQETSLHQYIEHRHLPRLIPENGLAAVEIHWRLFNSNKIKELQPEVVLKSKQSINGIFIPCNTHLLQHSILNWEINNQGNYFSKIGFRPAFDSLTILNRSPDISILNELKNSYSKNYFQLLSLFFEEIKTHPFKKTNLKLQFFKHKLKHQSVSNVINLILEKLLYFKILLKRLYLFIVNKNYRKEVIADQKRIFKLLKK